MLNKFNEWFDIYNRRLFNNELPKINIKKSHGKKRLGCYRYRSGAYKPGTISISTAYYFDDIKFKEILIHEMIHAYIHYKDIYDDSSHGREFVNMMNRVNEDLKDEGIEITIKTEDLEQYEVKNKVSYPFIIVEDLGIRYLMRIAKSRLNEYKSKYLGKAIGAKLFFSNSDLLNSLRKSINKTNLYKVEEGNELYKELVREGVINEEQTEYENEEQHKTTVYAVHIAKRIFKVDVPEAIMRDVIFNINDEVQEDCLELLADALCLRGDLPISVNDMLDAIILLAKGAHENGYGGLNGFDDKYIKL